ncbi:hypothetical protein BC936DRAFT_142804 [Jimgerdemannia flammicorona]|uniref:Uncharacterized protein n=1 Tax=Jimgerdemannia flammicorona TaxID=994334 RepID=A0A433DET4_9FUNG|nr:hypothetical protein BC936DRAFT_142804 [Jimgerdemannia flammicorona]
MEAAILGSNSHGDGTPGSPGPPGSPGCPGSPGIGFPGLTIALTHSTARWSSSGPKTLSSGWNGSCGSEAIMIPMA